MNTDVVGHKISPVRTTNRAIGETGLELLAQKAILSVIIPTWNEEQSIASLLQYLEQIIPANHYEIIVCDGGSTDQTLAILRQFPKLRLVQSPLGRARQLNAGASVAKGQWLYFLHADTFPPPDLWEQFLAVKATQTDAACFSIRFDSEHPLLRFCSWCSKFNWNGFRYGDQSLLVRREVFDACGGYREELEIMEGNELIGRLDRRVNFRLLPAEVQTSARKYRQYGPVYLQSVYTLIYLLSRAGLSQGPLVQLYRFLLPPTAPPSKNVLESF